MLLLETQVGAEGDSGLQLHLNLETGGCSVAVSPFHDTTARVPHPLAGTDLNRELLGHNWKSSLPQELSGSWRKGDCVKGDCAVLKQGRKVPGLPPEMPSWTLMPEQARFCCPADPWDVCTQTNPEQSQKGAFKCPDSANPQRRKAQWLLHYPGSD